MLILLLVSTALGAPALKEVAVARLQDALGGAEALQRHRDMIRSLMGDQEITEPRHSVHDSPDTSGHGLSEIDLNDPISGYLYQGDIMLSDAAVARLTAETGSTRVKRGAPNVATKRFNKNQPIGFIFSSEMPESARKLIRETTATIAANTCLSFKENSGVGTQLEFLRGGGCWSRIGEDPANGKQPISIDDWCESKHTVTHETFHALGIGHTITRKDRDSFVIIHRDRVMRGKEGNFDKLSDAANNNFGVPYEYGSVMHYHSKQFAAVAGQTTIEAKYDFYNNTMGQSQEVTFNDWKLVNILYNCSSHCPKQMVCQNGGYSSPKNCNACVCPEFFSGTNCEKPKKLISLTASTPTGESVFHQDQNLPMFGNYDEKNYGRDGPTVIRAPEGRKIRVTITQLSVSAGKWRPTPCPPFACEFVGIEIRDVAGGDLTGLGKKFCCPDPNQGYSFVSMSNVVGYKSYVSPGRNSDITVTYNLV